MADNSLDDFFAKKDKSKKKSKVKSVAVEVVDESDGSKSTKKEKKKEKSNKSGSSNNSTNRSVRRDDEEWNDFEEEKAADYSNLRIQTLQVKEENDKDLEGEEEEFDENGEVREKKDGASGPWNKSNSTSDKPGSCVEEEKAAPATPVNTGKYIPPSQRAAMAAAASGASGPGGSRRKKVLPNIRSDFDFPTLATGPGSTGNQGQSMSENPNQRRGASLATSNKFSVLQD